MVMQKRLRKEGGDWSQFVQQIRSIGYNEGMHVEFAVVKSPPPSLVLELERDQFKISVEDGDNLYVAESLTRHERVVTIEHVEKTVRDLGDRTEYDHLHTDDLLEPYTSFKQNYLRLQFEDVLKEGDRVLVLTDSERSTYTVIDRVVTY